MSYLQSIYPDVAKNGHPPLALVRSLSAGSEHATSPKPTQQLTRQQSAYKVLTQSKKETD